MPRILTGRGTETSSGTNESDKTRERPAIQLSNFYPAQTKTITVSSILLRDTKKMAAGFSLRDDTPGSLVASSGSKIGGNGNGYDGGTEEKLERHSSLVR